MGRKRRDIKEGGEGKKERERGGPPNV